MLIPNFGASISMKLIYPANSHVEQQIAFLPKWIECFQSNHHAAKGFQINLAGLLFLLLTLPQLPVPKSTHSTWIRFFFSYPQMKCCCLPWKWRFSCFFSSGNIQTGVGKLHEPTFPEDVLTHSLQHVWQKLWEGWHPPNTNCFNSSIFIELPSRHKDFPRASGLVKDTRMSLLMMDSSFPGFTTFSSICENRDEETFELPLGVISCGQGFLLF